MVLIASLGLGVLDVVTPPAVADAAVVAPNTPAAGHGAASNPWGWPAPQCKRPSAPMPGLMLLQVRIDPVQPGHIAELYINPAGTLYARRPALEDWTGASPAGPALMVNGVRWYPLAPELAGRYRLDSCTQTLWLVPLPQSRPGQDLDLSSHPAYRVLPRATGAALSADVQQVIQNAGPAYTSGTANVDVFGAPGVDHSGWLFDARQARRLDSFLEFDAPASHARIIVGDSITQTGQFIVAPLRFGGIQIGTDFGLTPAFNPLALPSVSGSAALPGTLQIYQDGILQSTHPTREGPFSLTNVPVLTGLGTLQIVTANALGQQVTVSTPFYHSVALLRPGLIDYSAALGLLREDYTLPDDHYATEFSALGFRYGLNDTTTAGAHLQWSGSIQNLSLLLAHAWPRLGLLTLQTTSSTGGAPPGLSGTLGFQRDARTYGFGATLRLTSPHYVELGNPLVPIRRLNANAYLQVIKNVDAPVNYTAERYHGGLQLRLLGAGLTDTLASGWFVSISFLRATPGGNNYDVTLTHAFGTNGDVSVGGSHDPTRGGYLHFNAQQNPPGRIGTSYSGYAETGHDGIRDVGVDHTTENYGASATFRSFHGDQAIQIEARSGLAFMDGDVFAVRNPEEGFAVADLPGARDIPVFLDNLPAGRTDAEGRALVAPMNPYQPTQISVSPADLPVTLPLSRTRLTVAVPNGAAIVRFPSGGPVRRSLHLVLANGAFVPAGATLRIDGALASLPVGYDGLVYLAIPRTHQLSASWPGGSCAAVATPADGDGTHLLCRKVTP